MIFYVNVFNNFEICQVSKLCMTTTSKFHDIRLSHKFDLSIEYILILTSMPPKISPFHNKTFPLSSSRGWGVSLPRWCNTDPQNSPLTWQECSILQYNAFWMLLQQSGPLLRRFSNVCWEQNTHELSLIFVLKKNKQLLGFKINSIFTRARVSIICS